MVEEAVSPQEGSEKDNLVLVSWEHYLVYLYYISSCLSISMLIVVFHRYSGVVLQEISDLLLNLSIGPLPANKLGLETLA